MIKITLFILFLFFPGILPAQTASSYNSYDEVTYSQSPLLKGYLCKPSETGPYPAVIFNHGGKGNIIGGDPKGICQALAKDGFIGFSPIRRPDTSMPGRMADIFAALTYLQNVPKVDRNRIGMIGFSSGGLITYVSGTRYPELKALVIMAAAPPPDNRNFETGAFRILAPVLLLVAQNDNVHQGVDHVANMKRIDKALKKAGKKVELIVYPPYGTDGHKLFY